MSFGSFLNKGILTAGPAHWKPWAVWDSYKGITTATGVSEWADTIHGYRFEQSTTSQQPELTQDTSEFNNKKYLSFDNSTNEKLALNTTDVPLEDHRFFHDGTTSWRMSCVLVPRGTGGSIDPLITTTIGSSNPGIRVDYRDTGQLRFFIFDDSTNVNAIINDVTVNIPHLIDFEFDHITEEMRIRKNGGEWTTADTSGLTYSSNDSNGSLTLANYAGGGAAHANLDIAHLFITKTLPSTQTSNDMLDWYGKYFAFKNPDLMNPWAIWDASLGVSSGQTTWTDQISSRRFNETGTITLNSNDANWNNQDALSFPQSDYYELDTTDTPLEDQRFLFDGYEDYDLMFLVRPTDGGATPRLLDSSNNGTGTGLRLMWIKPSEDVRLQIFDSGSKVGEVIINDVPSQINTPHIVHVRIQSGVLKMRVNAGAWFEDSSVIFPTGVDATSSLWCMRGVEGTCPYIFITKDLMSPMQQEIIIDYFFDRWWAEFDSSVVCAWHSQAVQKDSSDNALRLLDVSHNGNHIENDGAGTYATVTEIDGHPVLDFDGSSSYMLLPAAFNEAVTGGEDLPHTVISGLSPEAIGGQIWFVGADTNNRVNMVISSGDRYRSDKEDGTTTKIAQSDAVFPLDEWNVITSACAGTTIRHLDGLEDATSDTDLDVGSIPATSNGWLGARLAGSPFGNLKISAQIYATQELKGGALAKAIRWVQKRTPKR